MTIRRTLACLLAGGLLMTSAACAGDDLAAEDSGSGSGDDTSSAESLGPVRIAGQNFPEATLVAEMYSLVLEDAGFEPSVTLVDTRDVYMADFPGGVDVVPEYVGGIVNFLNSQENGDSAQPIEAGDGAELQEQGQDLLDGAGVTLLDQSEAADANAFFVTQEYADAEGVSTLSDLEGVSVVLAAAPDCEGRLDCEGGLSDQYGIDVTKVLPLGYASDQTYQSVIDGESQLGETSTTDGTLESQGLVILEDDQQVQPAQNLVPAVSTEFLDAHPEVEQPLNDLMAALTTENLTELNGRVAVDREQPADVARSFLEEQGLL